MMSRYQREYESYVRAHRSLGNLAIHAVLVPVEQLCALWVVANLVSWRVALILQLATLASPRLFLGVAQFVLLTAALMLVPRIAAWKAVGGFSSAIAFQVVVGHWWLERNSPSAASDGVNGWSILFQVPVAWEAFVRKLWIELCRLLCFMHWACSPGMVDACRSKEPRSFFYCLDGKSVRITTSDNEKLGAFVLVPPRLSSVESARRLVLFFHGNCGSRYGVSASRRPSPRVELCRALATLFGDTVVVGFDYRGFADSTGSPTEEGLALDSEAVLAYARKIAPNAQIILYGQSLGSAVASRLAVSFSCDALVLDAAFPSVKRAALTYPFVRPLSKLLGWCGLLDSALRSMPDTFETGAPLLPPHIPLLMIHKAEDDVVPVSLGRQVFEAATAARSAAGRDRNHYTRFLQIDGTTKIMRRHHVDSFTSPLWKAALDDLFLHIDTR